MASKNGFDEGLVSLQVGNLEVLTTIATHFHHHFRSIRAQRFQILSTAEMIICSSLLGVVRISYHQIFSLLCSAHLDSRRPTQACHKKFYEI